MEDFKKIVKMKTGGAVKAEEYCSGGKAKYKTGGKVDKADVEQDKKVVKKAINLHDDQLHEGEKTDLSKLKKGGRAKKKEGTVKKFADGGQTGILARIGNRLKRNVMGTPEQNAAAQARMDAMAQATPAPMPQTAPTAPTAPMPQGVPAQKRGGKVKGKK